ncbi:flagellar hook-basal body complex protein FliE [Tunturibacter empetritectus]|uniref:Flagellar hook-basal body complex protein FliE n=1 Tax=Tunturiibacter empetritectus TaxID=3069691 RepID=A0A7W8MQY9_9BACT|nr:flagellar hook-basal body complex protein FliE [Edaphobacter lichenicola]MBB5315719.1 flagellar hook-basal body complex protein FliE [Edaphobacter lichenicola]
MPVGSGVMSGVGIGGLDDGFLSDAGVAALNAGGAGSVPFAGVLQSMVKETTKLDQKASEAVTGLLNGSGVEVHDAMIATQKANMAFELALQVRNKAVGAYQQMMGMQF